MAVFEDKYDKIAVSHGNELYLPPDLRQDRAPTFVCSLVSAKSRTDKTQFIRIRKSKQRNPNNSYMGLNVRNSLGHVFRIRDQ